MSPIADVWMQHVTPEFLGDDMFATLRRWMKLETVPDDIPLDWTLQAYEAAQISKGLLSAWTGPQGALIPNDAVADWVSRSGGRFEGIGSVDIARPMEGVREVRRCVKQLGFKGIRIIPWLWGLPPNDRRYYPIYAECIELGVPFCLQVGHTGPMKPSEPGRPIPYLDDVAHEFPDLVIVAGHIGYPWTQEMITLATKHPNVYIDTSAYKPSRYPPELIAFMKERGRHKVMFGTNYPMIAPADCLGELAGLELDDTCRTLFLWSNAAKVFRLTA